MEIVNRVATTLGVDAITMGIWAAAGVVLGLIMIGKRPLGLFGDLLIGIVGAVGGGWLFVRFVEPRGVDLGAYAKQIASSLSDQNAAYVGAAAEAFIGALILLVLVRLIIRR